MVITDYTKYLLNHGVEVKVCISPSIPNAINPAKLCAMRNCDAYYDENRGSWFVNLTQENWQAKCKALRGFVANYILRKH